MNHCTSFLRVIVLFLAGLLPALPALAQEGVKIGLTFTPIISFASVTDSDNNDIPGLETSSKLSFAYGLMFNYGFTENYAFHSGIHIVRKGFKRNQTVDNLPVSQDVFFTSLEVPIALKLRSNEVGNGVFIKGLFGISTDIQLGYRNEYTGSNPVTGEPAQSGTTRTSNLANPLALSFIFGPGAEIVLDRIGTVNVGVIYHRGLTNLNNKSKFTGPGSEESIKVSYFSLDLGYYF